MRRAASDGEPRGSGPDGSAAVDVTGPTLLSAPPPEVAPRARPAVDPPALAPTRDALTPGWVATCALVGLASLALGVYLALRR